jgi:hypothetical protein
MKRVRNWLFNAITVLSLLLSVAACIAWFECRSIGSIANAPSIGIKSDPYCCVALAYKGVVYLYELPDGPERILGWSALGAGTIYDHGGRVFFIAVDYWLIITAGAVLPLCWGIRSIRRAGKHAIPGICVYCGYDLRATLDRCPECGTVPVKTEHSK